MFGEPPLQRWAGSWSLYSSLASDSYSVSLGARVGGVLVGVLIGSVAGRCHLCQVLAGEPPPVDAQLAIDWQFHQNIAAVHRRVPEHAWVAKVVSEPALQGQGIGRHLVGAALDLLRSDTPVDVVLECAPNRASFYERAGFEALTTFVDPAGPDAFLMHQQIPSRPQRQPAPAPNIAP